MDLECIDVPALHSSQARRIQQCFCELSLLLMKPICRSKLSLLTLMWQFYSSTFRQRSELTYTLRLALVWRSQSMTYQIVKFQIISAMPFLVCMLWQAVTVPALCIGKIKSFNPAIAGKVDWITTVSEKNTGDVCMLSLRMQNFQKPQLSQIYDHN